MFTRQWSVRRSLQRILFKVNPRSPAAANEYRQTGRGTRLAKSTRTVWFRKREPRIVGFFMTETASIEGANAERQYVASVTSGRALSKLDLYMVACVRRQLQKLVHPRHQS
jgi:hypothetical protein